MSIHRHLVNKVICHFSTLRKADELRLDMVAGNRTVYRTSSRITVTLIALVLMCLILVFPSEGVHFIKDISVDRLENYKTAIIYTNLLQVCRLNTM